MASLRDLGYPSTMSSEPASSKRSAATGIVGLPVDHLTDGKQPRPAPTADDLLNCDYEPIRLEDLLCGLEPLPDNGLSAPSLEPALLLAEIAQPSPMGNGGWAAETAPVEAPAPAEIPHAFSVDPMASLREAEPGAMMHVITTMAEASAQAEAVHETAPAPEESGDARLSAMVDALTAAQASLPERHAEEASEPEAETTDHDDAARLSVMVEALIAAHSGDASLPEPTTEASELEVGAEAGAEAEAEPEPEPDPDPEPEPEPEPEPVDLGEAAELSAMVDALIAAYHPDGVAGTHGDASLPERLDAVAILLSDPPPAQDFAALDALYTCWPKATQNSSSRALLAVAHNLSRNFGLPGKLPMSSSKAWRMLSPSVFEAELAQRLIDVGAFIADWQKTQRTFLILEFGEIELIEHLFEVLSPANHADLLAGVMNFKVLSNRRMGLLRRIPNRLKRQVTPLLPDRKEEALVIMAHTKALLEQVADPSGFAPIVDTAGKMLEELEKMMKSVASIGLPPQAPPPGGGMALGRMG